MFLLGLLTAFKVIETVIFKKMCWKNITNMVVVRLIGYFTHKMLYLESPPFDFHLNKVIELANVWFKGHIICICTNL